VYGVQRRCLSHYSDSWAVDLRAYQFALVASHARALTESAAQCESHLPIRSLVAVITASARSLPAPSGAAVGVQLHRSAADETDAAVVGCFSRVAAVDRRRLSQSAAVPPSSSAAAGPGRSQLLQASHWLSPDDAAAAGGGPRTVDATSDAPRSPPEQSVDVGDVCSLSDLDVQLDILKR